MAEEKEIKDSDVAKFYRESIATLERIMEEENEED